MNPKKKAVLLFVVACGCAGGSGVKKRELTRRGKVETTDHAGAVLWRNPSDIGSRNLFYGPGGAAHAPHGKFTFLSEDLEGSNLKFTLSDESGVKWKAKVGAEARPETVASRLVWAAGFTADEDYLVPTLRPLDLNHKLRRGKKLMAADGSFTTVRLKRERKPSEKLGTWKWSDNPFKGTREFNGLRVLMATINNWDLKDDNTAILADSRVDGSPQRVYEVSDLGATFGANGLETNRSGEKGNLDWYRRSGFITSRTPEFISFETPRRPTVLAIVNPREFFSRMKMRWIGRDIPVTDAAWIGHILNRLSHEQIRDAFRAAGYSAAEVEGFSQILEKRIATLSQLSEDRNEALLRP